MEGVVDRVNYIISGSRQVVPSPMLGTLGRGTGQGWEPLTNVANTREVCCTCRTRHEEHPEHRH